MSRFWVTLNAVWWELPSFSLPQPPRISVRYDNLASCSSTSTLLKHVCLIIAPPSVCWHESFLTLTLRYSLPRLWSLSLSNPHRHRSIRLSRHHASPFVPSQTPPHCSTPKQGLRNSASQLPPSFQIPTFTCIPSTSGLHTPPSRLHPLRISWLPHPPTARSFAFS